MQEFIQRNLISTLKQYMEIFPAVAILGPRQCGKSTLVKHLNQHFDVLYLDLQKESDLNKLSEPELFLNLTPIK